MDYIDVNHKQAFWFQYTRPQVKKCYFKGDLKYLSKQFKRVCIVGSRKMTTYGRQVLEYLIPFLVEHKIIIVSGGAFGVDIFTHQLVKLYGAPGIVVLPSSIEQIYPKQNHSTINHFANSGLLLSESNLAYPNKYDFIARNRIMAAISDLVIVIEAAEKSGSLHTAGFALENGITVATIPGTIFAPQSRGCNNLLAQGAHIILKPADVLELI